METFSRLGTEEVADRFAELDLWPTTDLVRACNDEDARVAGAVRAAEGAITSAVDAIADRMARGGRLRYVGAGTGGRLAVVDAAECAPTFNTDPGQVVAVLAGGAAALADAREGDEDDAAAGAADLLRAGVRAGDAVVCISASGRTPYALGAAEAAKAHNALLIGISCNAGTRLSAVSDIAIEVPVGPEIIAGSTRLKAGTAQKLVLNTLSTLVMVRLGRTYGSLMVDVRTDNEKLRARAADIVARATGLDSAGAAQALAAAGGEAKVAVVATLADVPVAEARRRLTVAGGRARRALDVPPVSP